MAILFSRPFGKQPLSISGEQNPIVVEASDDTFTYTTIGGIAPIVYSLAAGQDSALFDINSSTGVVSFKEYTIFDEPVDVGENNVYNITFKATDALNSVVSLPVAIIVTEAEDLVFITPNLAPSVVEGVTAVATYTATGGILNSETPAYTYSIVAGGDAALFGINASTGALSFLLAPDYDTPLDIGTNNVYNVSILVEDWWASGDIIIAVSITVTEAP